MPPQAANARNLAPNPRDFTSFEEAFAFPIPVVRKFEAQLQSSLNDTRSRIRSLVGDSYRDLLGSADTIIDMHTEIQRLNSVMDQIAQQCNARVVEKAMAARAFHASIAVKAKFAQRRLAAELSLSSSCLTVAYRSTKTHDSPLLSAKLLLLSRLLLQSAAIVDHSPGLMDGLWRKHRTLSRNLLISIHDIVCRTEASRHQILDALAAYSLVTSSSPTDVLRHYLHLRRTMLGDVMNDPRTESLLQALDMLFQTLQQAQHLFPRRFADTLSRVRDAPLLQDETVRTAIRADLDICEALLPDSVRKYSHWFRQDQLASQSLQDMLKPWASEVLASIRMALQKSLAYIFDPRDVVRARKDYITRWMQCPDDITAIEPHSCVMQAREAFETRIADIVDTEAASIDDIVSRHLSERESKSHDQPSIWHPSMHTIGTARGAALFRRELDIRRQSKDASLQALNKQLDGWQHGLVSMSQAIKTMRDVRWHDVVDLDDTEGPDWTAIIRKLSKDDPDTLAERLNKGSRFAVQKVVDTIHRSVSSDSADGPHAIHLLRVSREFLEHCTATTWPSNEDLPLSKHVETLHDLYFRVGAYIAARATEHAKTSTNILACSPVVQLWEGTPAVPLLPSTACIRFVYNVNKAMQEHGSALWTASAVDAVKTALFARVNDAVRSLLSTTAGATDVAEVTTMTTTGKPNDVSSDANRKSESESKTMTIDEADTPGDSTGSASDDTKGAMTKQEEASDYSPAEAQAHQRTRRRAIVVQIAFDTLYLSTILGPSESKSESDRTTDPARQWTDLLEHVRPKANAALELVVDDSSSRTEVDDGDEVWSRMTQHVLDYHRRTYLLVGLLCPPQT